MITYTALATAAATQSNGSETAAFHAVILTSLAYLHHAERWDGGNDRPTVKAVQTQLYTTLGADTDRKNAAAKNAAIGFQLARKLAKEYRVTLDVIKEQAESVETALAPITSLLANAGVTGRASAIKAWVAPAKDNKTSTRPTLGDRVAAALKPESSVVLGWGDSPDVMQADLLAAVGLILQRMDSANLSNLADIVRDAATDRAGDELTALEAAEEAAAKVQAERDSATAAITGNQPKLASFAA
jgi:hypothetical protein